MFLSLSKLSFHFINTTRFPLHQVIMSNRHLNIFQLQQLRKQQELRYKNVVQNIKWFQHKSLVARILSFIKHTSTFKQVCNEWRVMFSGIQTYETWFLEQRANFAKKR